MIKTIRDSKKLLLLSGTTLLTTLVCICGVSAVATAAEFGESDVEVSVTVPEIDQPGILAMTVAGSSTTLTESGSTALVRQFVGVLPTVTVTDTRDASEIPEGAGWTVLGSATQFSGTQGQAPIPAGNLGWSPEIVQGDQNGLVAAGTEVVTTLDQPTQPGNNVGLVDQELLFATGDSGAISPEGQWSADADLFLRTSADVAAGNYTSTITLSLFE